ncbi:MAG TPA: flavodoxin family protein [Clostridiales bacterium]|nr:flavodoxin family protein [Clostridiales bacterium]
MKILVLAGSPHLHGTTSYLADKFSEGAQEAGNEVIRFDVAKLKVHPCTGCDHCRRNDEKCIFDDDMSQIYPRLLEADAVVLVTPLYYFGMTAQLKAVIDRFYAINSSLRKQSKKLLLIGAGGDEEDWAMSALKSHYSTVCRYLGWSEGGMVLALGAETREDVENGIYAEAAKKMGREI